MGFRIASVRHVEKPWGVSDLGCWATNVRDGRLIGEVWFEAAGEKTAELLVKVLWTGKALSVQVHPDDAYAHSIGLPNGKTEAWYILSAAPNAKVAVGLNARLTRGELQAVIGDGSIAAHLAWRTVSADETIFIPAGTIHAIGAGIVLFEIQQSSDTTFRIFDPDHGRTLDIEHAVAAAHAEPAEVQMQPNQLSDERLLLVSSPHFIFERLTLPPGSVWRLQADQQTWVFCQSGSAQVDDDTFTAGTVIVGREGSAEIRVGSDGITCLVAYPGRGGPAANLLSR